MDSYIALNTNSGTKTPNRTGAAILSVDKEEVRLRGYYSDQNWPDKIFPKAKSDS